MPDHAEHHEEQSHLKNGLLTMGNLPSAPADPLPAISRRINRRRKVRYTASGIALAACAALLATAVVPALGGNAVNSPAASLTTDPTTEPTPDPTSTESPAPSRSPVPPGSIGSEEWDKGLPVGSQVMGVGFEEFVAGKQGPAYVVRTGGASVVVSYRENGTGRPCLLGISQFSEVRPRVCLDRELTGTQLESEQVDLFLGGATERLLLVFAARGVHDIELVSKAGDQISRDRPVGTKTSNDVRFSASSIDDGLSPTFGQVFAHGSAGQPDEGIAPPESKGGRSVLRAGGDGFEDFVPGKQGVGYVVTGFAEPGVAVSHQVGGTGAPCLTIAKLANPERVCFTGWKPGEKVRATIKQLPDGRVLVAGFAKLDVVRAYVVDRTSGRANNSIDPVATPTSQELAFFAYAYDKGETDPVRVQVTE